MKFNLRKKLKYLSLTLCFTALLYPLAQAAPFQKIILNWQPIDRAVSYRVAITDEQGHTLWTKDHIFPTGVEINPETLPEKQQLFYKVEGLDLQQKPVAPSTKPQPLYQGLHFNRYWEQMQEPYTATTTTPTTTSNYLVEKDVLIPPLKLTGEFFQMAYFPIYPVFSWVKVPQATNYQLKVEKIIGPYQYQEVENITLGNTYDYYGNHAYVDGGDYRYQIIAIGPTGKLAQSPWTYFHVTSKPKIIALGDSITHGGGAISTPPSQTLYNWESYTTYPILNAGYSGNTTNSMLKRLPRDVLQFHPDYVIIMGGINDLRLGTSAQVVINNLENMINTAKANHISPILLTVTPLNYQLTKEHVATPAANWQREWQIVNQWIKAQPNHLDITPSLVDSQNELKAQLTTDGLHPDAQGKAIIGNLVEKYLQNLIPKEEDHHA